MDLELASPSFPEIGWILSRFSGQVALPGMAAALAVAALRFDLRLTISPWVAVAVLLVALVAVAVGYEIANLAKPELTGAIANVITRTTVPGPVCHA
jgi:hypothetical protein